jgi:TonB family protein
MMDQSSYDAMKAVVGPRIYEKCIPQNVKVVPVSSAGSAVSDKALQEFIQSVLIYPNRARDNGEQGTVLMQFKIDAEGIISCLEVAKSATFELDREAYRILAGMPQWTPAKRNGVAVAAYYSVPVVFVLK